MLSGEFLEEWNPPAADDETDALVFQTGDHAQQFKKNRAFARGRKSFVISMTFGIIRGSLRHVQSRTPPAPRHGRSAG